MNLYSYLINTSVLFDLQFCWGDETFVFKISNSNTFIVYYFLNTNICCFGWGRGDEWKLGCAVVWHILPVVERSWSHWYDFMPASGIHIYTNICKLPYAKLLKDATYNNTITIRHIKQHCSFVCLRYHRSDNNQCIYRQWSSSMTWILVFDKFTIVTLTVFYENNCFYTNNAYSPVHTHQNGSKPNIILILINYSQKVWKLC